MTELERRALMGDQKAQDECTKQGIVLPCPCCKGKPDLWENEIGGNVQCEECGIRINAACLHWAISRWNTRPAPPIVRCGECDYWTGRVCGVHDLMKDETGYCSDFKKGGDENAAD